MNTENHRWGYTCPRLPLDGLGMENEGEDIFNTPDLIVFLDYEDREFLASVRMKW